MSLPAPYLDGEKLTGLVTPGFALRAIQDFFARHGADAVRIPPRIHLAVPERETVGLYMPAATVDYAGVKIVHLLPHQKPSVAAEVFLYESNTGILLFWGDGKPLTGLRTAAVSAAASLKLHAQRRHLLLFGAGVQAHSHLLAFAEAYPGLESIALVTRSQHSYERLRASLPEALRNRLSRCTEPPDGLARADLVITATPAPEPLFSWGDVSAECHVVGVGAATENMRELPPEAFLQCRVWLDTPQAIHEAGDCMVAQQRGWRPESAQGDLFDLLAKSPVNQGGATLFKSVGHAGQDLALLIAIWNALRLEIEK